MPKIDSKLENGSIPNTSFRNFSFNHNLHNALYAKLLTA